MKQYVLDNRRLLTWSAVLMLACFCAVALGAYLERTLSRAHYNAEGIYLGYRSLAVVPLLIVPGLVGLLIIGFGNVFLALAHAIRRLQLGFERIAMLLIPAVFAWSLYVNFEGQFSWHWRGFANAQQTIKWLLGGLFWTLTTTAITGIALVVTISLAYWVIEGFASPKD